MQPVYEYFEQIKGEDGLLKDSCVYLPELVGRNDVKWVPGAFEGILLRSRVDMSQPFYVNFAVACKLRKAVRTGKEKDKEKFTESFMKYSAITMTDKLLSNINKRVDKAKAVSFARNLLRSTERAELVKFCIALLGEYGDNSDTDSLMMLGSHEEFTLFASVAIKNVLNRSGIPYNEKIITLCNHLSGWGKIAAVMELDYTKQEARDYAIKYGCENKIALSYLSNVCAIKGKLVSFLKKTLAEEKKLDDDALEGICNIWEGLTDTEHPENDGLTDYPSYAEAFDLFVQAVEKYGYSDNVRVKKVIALVK